MRTKSRALGRPLAVALLVGALVMLVAACGSSKSSGGKGTTTSSSSSSSGVSGLYGSLPSTGGTPVKGGVLTYGQTSGATPTYILPITPAADASVFTAYPFQNQMFLPLYNGPQGATPEIDYQVSLAPAPTFSDGGKTVTIHMKTGYKWANGAPVDANDVVFDVDLIKAAVKESPANEEAYTPGLFPDSVTSISAPSKYTVVMHLNKVYNPGFFLNDQIEGVVFPLPSTSWNVASTGGAHLNYATPANAKKIYDYLNKASQKVATFGTNPLWKDADGPFVIKSFSATNGSYVLDANPNYSGTPKPNVAAFEGETFTGITPTLNALRTGAVDIATIDPSQLGQVGALRSQGVSVFGYPDFGWTAGFLNFKDKTGHFNSIISQLYARQALAHLEEQPAYVKGILKGAGDEAYGPLPTAPTTPYTPADAMSAEYPYSTADAAALLKAHGWKVVPNGTTTCQKAGTAADECGAGIPAGTPFKFVFAYLTPSTVVMQSLEAESFASEAKKIGIDVTLQVKSFNFLVQNYNDASPAAAKYTNSWGVSYFGGYTDDYYPTQNSIFNTTGSYNQGGYSSATADKLINNSVFSSSGKAVTAEASYLTSNVPALFFPNPDEIYGINSKVGGTKDAFLALTQYTPFGQYFWLKK